MRTLGERIRERREELGMTQAQLAERIGVKEATISRYESGDITNPPQERIAKMLDALKIDANYLMDWESDDTAEQGELDLMREEYRRRPGMRLLFRAARGSTEADLRRFAGMIEVFKDGRDHGQDT